mmetsp:Transcript_42901/g.134621  ORF Transcript_42901/g.134621 Transcript_42901/m.134621 type:complete len:245 (+) Transcript_42901:1854-2588(+)
MALPAASMALRMPWSFAASASALRRSTEVCSSRDESTRSRASSCPARAPSAELRPALICACRSFSLAVLVPTSATSSLSVMALCCCSRSAVISLSCRSRSRLSSDSWMRSLCSRSSSCWRRASLSSFLSLDVSSCSCRSWAPACSRSRTSRSPFCASSARARSRSAANSRSRPARLSPLAPTVARRSRSFSTASSRTLACAMVRAVRELAISSDSPEPALAPSVGRLPRASAPPPPPPPMPPSL